MNIDLNAKIHNRFDIEVVDAETGKVKQRAQAFNVVCRSYLYVLFKANDQNQYISKIAYGSGSGTPSYSDTALFSKIGEKSVVRNTGSLRNDTAGHYICGSCSIQLGVSEAVGTTITEVGLLNGWGDLLTHALLQDMNGNPISITKTNTDVININATVFCHYQSSYGGIFLRFNTDVSPNYRHALANWLLLDIFEGNGYIPLSKIHLDNIDDFTGYAEYFGNGQYDSVTFTKDYTNKRLTISGRVGIDHGNLTGGAKYIHVPAYQDVSGYSDLVTTGLVIPVAIGNQIDGYNVTGESVGTGDGSRTAFTLKFDCASALTVYLNGAATTAYTRSGRTITFNSAPAVGAVVTADYFSDTVPKDADHVFDLTVTMQFGEYTPE